MHYLGHATLITTRLIATDLRCVKTRYAPAFKTRQARIFNITRRHCSRIKQIRTECDAQHFLMLETNDA